MRPRDDDESDDGNSQDIASDEELEISRSELMDALITRIGGKGNEESDANENEGVTHFQNSTAAIALNQTFGEPIWRTSLLKFMQLYSQRRCKKSLMRQRLLKNASMSMKLWGKMSIKAMQHCGNWFLQQTAMFKHG